MFDSAKSGWLSEDNGAYVFAFDAPLQGAAPAADELTAGERRLVNNAAWNVASVTRARLIAAQGELPRPPRQDGAEFWVADLRNERDEVATLDYGDAAGVVVWSIGRAVRLAELSMSGLREASEKALSGQGFACPSCGASLQLTLATTQSIACHQCKAVIDVSQGVGADLSHYAQSNAGHDGAQPLIPLGTSGRLALDGRELDWQVVGYQERCDVPADGDDEQTFWREYLLFNRQEGFVFLVDSEDGWSWVKPLTGAPQVRGDVATWNNKTYRQRERYDAKVTWVLGEFYWRVRRDEVAQVTDYVGTAAASQRRLSSERTGCRAHLVRRGGVGRAGHRARLPPRAGRRIGAAAQRRWRVDHGGRRPTEGWPDRRGGGGGPDDRLLLQPRQRLRRCARDIRRGEQRIPAMPAQLGWRWHGLSHRRRLVRWLQQRRRTQVKTPRRRHWFNNLHRR